MACQRNSTTTLGFTGEQTDPNDLIYLWARYYHPKLGAFTSVDPVPGVGGSTGWNGYLYANANPANLTDPSGRCVDPLSFVVCATLVGAGIGVTIDAGIQVADIAFNHKPLTSFDWGRTARAGVIGGVGGAVGAGVIGASVLGASYLGITAGANSALAYGVGTIALSGVAGGRAAKLTENALYHRPLDQGLWNPGDIARDALLA
ncbi:MAG: RHS repeat-associated core domain-containing protein, partial [Anaerolineae bacterium]|nr:RHS repeat-associated core domain-containing protein [Anaerolineae bacterium]